MNQILSVRNFPKAYTSNIIKNIDLVRFDKNDNLFPVGSLSYRFAKYPADIDVMEFYKDCCTVEEVANKMAVKIRNTVSNIIKSSLHYVIELKVGFDERYNINIGVLQNDIYDPNTKEITEKLQFWDKNKLMDSKDISFIKNLLFNSQKNGLTYDKINDIIRKYKIIRWSDVDILKGYKILPLGIKKTLVDALQQNSMVKMDVVGYVDGKFLEISNILFLIVTTADSPNGYYIINFGVPYTDHFFQDELFDQIPKEIEKLFYSKFYYSPFKGLKRLFSFARQHQNIQLAENLKDILNGDVSLAYQLKSEVETLLLLYEKLKNIPISFIDEQVNFIKLRISNILSFDNRQLDLFYNLFNSYFKNKNHNNSIHVLEIIKDILKKFCNLMAVDFLEKNGMYPINRNFLPKKLSYLSTNFNHNIMTEMLGVDIRNINIPQYIYEYSVNLIKP